MASTTRLKPRLAYAARLQAEARRFSLIRSELQRGTNQILRPVTWVMVPAGLLLIFSEFFRSHDALRPGPS